MKHSTIIIALSILVLFSCNNESKSDETENETKTNKTTETTDQSVTTEEVVIDIDTVEENSSLQNSENNLPETVETSNSDVPGKDEDYTLPMITIPDADVEEVDVVVAVLKPNHSVWNTLLKSNVNSSGSVNYPNMKSSLTAINTYITQLENLTDQSAWSRNEKLAYWINLYNAATVRLIVQNYPVQSITDINGGKPWDLKVVKVGSKNYTLNQIENDIIRPKFNEPRIHFAVNCAAMSCPKLMNSAFIPNQLNSQLTKQAKSFINSSKNDIAANKIAISKIFDWYSGDFGTSVIDYLNKYSTIQIEDGTAIEYKEYNWDLNK